ncbi:MAG: nitroreductase family deazaflavin-dependent oxidoreductase [Gammaproteobacteria bacterium]|nr:nitroreductase family deazaflavin-dependent oxidoreductase [Gammaproteobacteria bacterium]
MKLPEPLFIVINPVVKALLRSPLHSLLSDSVMIVEFRGRRSGKEYSTPVRYVQEGELIRAYSNKETQWWRNLRDGAEAVLQVSGKRGRYITHVIENDEERIRQLLADYFVLYPEDAAYHDVKLAKSGFADPDDLTEAAKHAVVVEAKPQTTAPD